MAKINISVDDISNVFKEKITELQEEPEFQWNLARTTYETDEDGKPLVKIAVGNVPLDYDLWAGLRNPAVLGLHPAGLREIWEFYANRRRPRVDESGRQTIFQVPRSYEYARKNYGRAVIASVMLPFSSKVVDDYLDAVKENAKGSSHKFTRMYNDVNLMINKATVRAAIDLVDGENAVLAMNDKTVTALSNEAISKTRQGISHGPSKGGNYPQKSIAALLGLGQFGISRILFRDEVVNGKVRRYVGPIRSVILFDKEEPVKDGRGGVVYPSEPWRKYLFSLYDFTNTDPGVNGSRFCSYIPLNDGGCGKCIDGCPSGAEYNSAPSPDGGYADDVGSQTHRFWEGKLQFDYASCCDDRGQLSTLYPEWSCARCVTICASEGVRNPVATKVFYSRMDELTKG